MIQRQKGAILVLTAVMLPVLLAFMGLAVDLAHLYAAQAKLQNAADAAALAGGWQVNTADTTVQKYLSMNLPEKKSLHASSTDANSSDEVNYEIKIADLKSDNDTSNGKTPKQQSSLTLNLHGRTDTMFMRLVGLDSVPINATAKVRITGIAGPKGFTDDMFGYVMTATDGIDIYTNHRNTSQWQYAHSINGNIWTGGKINFFNAESRAVKRYDSWWNEYTGWETYATSSTGQYSQLQGQVILPPDVDKNSIWNNGQSFNGYDNNNTQNNNKPIKIGIDDKNDDDWANPEMHNLIAEYKNTDPWTLEQQGVRYQQSSSTDMVYIGDGGTQRRGIYSRLIVYGNHWWSGRGNSIYLQYNGDGYREPQPGSFDIYASLNGDIHLNANAYYNDGLVPFQGILYAPNGTVYINGPWDFRGSIVAKKIVLNGEDGYPHTAQKFTYVHYFTAEKEDPTQPSKDNQHVELIQ